MCEEIILPAFSDKYEENNKVLAVMAVEHDMRMFVQQGCFTIHSDKTPLDIRIGNEQYLSKIIIPASVIQDFANEIKICGIRKGDIFPDLQNLSDELKVQRGS